jgi:two-component system phosphate regulon response regulator OmpR
MSDSAHVLLVDDDARLRALLSRFLTENGYRVTTADSAAAAREKLRFMDFDLMVLDVMMPGESGLELTGDLRSERAPTLPILLLTARGGPEDIIAGFEAGADDYLGKPFDPRVLLARIRAMLRRAQPPTLSTGPLQLGAAVFDRGRGGRTRLSRARRWPPPWGSTM